MPELTPELILSLWAGGVAGGAALVVWWRVVGLGFVWLVGGVVILVGVPAALAGGGPPAWGGAVAAAAAIVAGRAPRVAAGAFAAATVAFVVAAVPDGGLVASLTGAGALGGITAEMLLGHWYLVDPRLPRWALRRLDAIAVVSLAADVVVLWLLGAFSDVDGVLLTAFAVLAGTSALLGVGVWFSLRQPAYAGVMAATGLSYLAVLTVVGSVVTGRGLIDGAAI